MHRKSDGMLGHYQPEAVALKFQILSDLHTEFSDYHPPDTDADVVVLAGDIGVGAGGIKKPLASAGRLHSRIPRFLCHPVRDIGQLLAAAPANIQVLSDDTCEIDGVRFLGSTLWTDFKFYGEGEAWFARQKAKVLIEDFTSIRNSKRLFNRKTWSNFTMRAKHGL